MSDGPHRSLPMRQGWRDVAERGDRSAFDREQVAEAIPEALRQDWGEEQCDGLARDMRSMLGDARQGSLFGQSSEDLENAVNRLSGSGYPMRRLLLEGVRQAIAEGFAGGEALLEGAAYALAVRCGAGIRQVEEHYLRKSTEHRAANVRSRLEDGATLSDFKAIARGLLKMGGGVDAPPIKRGGLDDGVRL